jgi:hypothetical protein
VHRDALAHNPPAGAPVTGGAVLYLCHEKPSDNPADPFKKALAEATKVMADDRN